MSVNQNLNDVGGPDTPEPDIVLAVEARDLEALKDLLRRRGVEVDARGIYGRTALMAAVTSRELEMARLLLANGADITIKNYFGRTAMDYASGEVKGMLEKASGIAPPTQNKNTPQGVPAPEELVAAVEKRDIVAVRDLLRRGVDVAAADRLKENGGSLPQVGKGLTMLGWLAYCGGAAEIATLLIDAGADVNGRDKWGITPLMRAVGNCAPGMARLLIARGASVDEKDDAGNTVWDVVRLSGHEFMRDILRGAIEDRRCAVAEQEGARQAGIAEARVNALHAIAANRQKDLIALARASKVTIKRVS